MRDEIPHMSVIHSALGRVFPRVVGTVIVREHADDIDSIDIFERVFGRVDQFAAKYEVQTLCHMFKPLFYVLLGAVYVALGAVSSE